MPWGARAEGAGRHWLVLALMLAALGNGVLTARGSWSVASETLNDLRFPAHPRQATGIVALVDIDEASIRALGTWPWPRSIHAAIVDRLVAGGAETIAFDVDFSSRADPAADAAFAAALARAGDGVILAAQSQRPSAAETNTILTRPLPLFEAHAWPALVDVRLDRDRLLRTVPVLGTSEGMQLPSLSTSLAGMPGHGEAIRIDYSIEAGAIDRLSAVELIEGRIPKARIAGRKVIVGATAITLRDYFETPHYGSLPGALVQALAVESLLQGRDLARPSPLVTLAGLGVLFVAGLAITLTMPLPAAVSMLLAGMAALEAGALVLQAERALSLDTLPWHVAILAAIAVDVGYEVVRRRLLLVAARSSRQRTQAILDRVFADSVAGLVIVDDSGAIRAASRAAVVALGLTTDESLAAGESLAGRRASAVLPAALLALLQEGAPPSGSLHLATPQGQRIFQYTVSRSRSAGDGEDDAAWTATCITFNDVTDRARDQERIERLARFDSLTGLPNRNAFMERLAQETDATGSALLLIDLDGFKAVNDTLGQEVGDEMLKAVAGRVAGLLGSDAVLSRLDGDEFAVLSAATEAEALGDAVREAFRRPFDAAGRRAVITASIGLAVGEPGVDGEELARRATLALSRAKHWGGKAVGTYSLALDREVRAQKELERELARALEEGQFRVFYQAQKSCGTETLSGAEALVRWLHPERGLVPPGMFIPALERTDLIGPVGAFVLRQACQDAASWPRPLRIAVNVAAPQLMSGDFSQMLREVLAETGLDPGRLDIELTESLFIQDEKVVMRELSAIRALGVGLALDDFGTGYSSLGYIKRLPFTKVKLDRSFVTDLPGGRESVAIIQAVIAMAAALDMKVVAEGVETAEQWQSVRLLGCDEVQGYLFGEPEDADAFRRRLEAAPARMAVGEGRR